MSHRINVTAQSHTAHVFSGRITDEPTGEEIVTRTNIGAVAFRRYRISRALIGTGVVEVPIDVSEITIPETEYQLYDTLQEGLDYSTDAKPFTFLWRVPDRREPFFDSPGTYCVVLRFYPRDDGEVETLTFEVGVT